MALLDEVKTSLDRLAPRGWAKLFAKHGLDIGVPKSKLAAELQKPLAVKRTLPGFEDFVLDGIRAIEPGDPARSLLYHALASAAVTPLTSDDPSDEDFPTLDDLDAVENYIYGVTRRKVSSFQNPIVAVFAYQYRGRRLSPHRQHADLAFSRTGIARVGTEDARYDGATRAFDPRPRGEGPGFAVLPARYAAFIAEYRSPATEDAVLRPTPGVDGTMPFLFPVHKLFAGDECLYRADGTPLPLPAIKFVEFHRNEKLARIHRKGPDNPGRIAPLPQFDVQAPPFVRTSKDSRDLVQQVRIGASVLIQPIPNTLVRTARQSVGDGTELVRFRVPKEQESADSSNRFWTSLQLPASEDGRAAPEYANMRQEVVKTAGGAFRLKDLNDVRELGTPPSERFAARLAAGGYEAAHFIDGTCDGAIAIDVPEILKLDALPAFSLVTAVDYFPQVDQVEIEEWLERIQHAPTGLSDPRPMFPQGGPKPLSDGRFAVRANHLVPAGRHPNPSLPDPRDLAAGLPAFRTSERANLTATAIVGRAPSAATSDPTTVRNATSWLPDAASDVFAPGWDVSEYAGGYVSYGLGSPFPEDAKLCAALNSFWPAVAPDASRTYGFGDASTSRLPTTIPLLDRELGYHPSHPRVLAGEVESVAGWDGDFGPYLATSAAQRFVDASNPARADQTRRAFDGMVGFSGLDRVDGKELIRRIEDLQFCRLILATAGVSSSAWLITVEQIPDWETWASVVWTRAAKSLKGAGYVYLFAEVDSGSRLPEGDPPYRQRFKVRHTVEIQLSTKRVSWRRDAQTFTGADRPGDA